jgi:hypothetical protein
MFTRSHWRLRILKSIIYRMVFLPPLGHSHRFVRHRPWREAYADVVNVQPGQQLRAAIWWPEFAITGIHNVIHLKIGKPNGLLVGTAFDSTSVFQYLPVKVPSDAAAPENQDDGPLRSRRPQTASVLGRLHGP